MEKRIGVLAILLEDRKSIPKLNTILGEYNEEVLARQGLPLRDKGLHIISLILETSTDKIGALAGKIGRLPGVQVKSVLTKPKETGHDHQHPPKNIS